MSNRRRHLNESDNADRKFWALRCPRKLTTVGFGRHFSGFFPWLISARAAISFSSHCASVEDLVVAFAQASKCVLVPHSSSCLAAFSISPTNFTALPSPLPQDKFSCIPGCPVFLIPLPLPPRSWDYTHQVSTRPGMDNGASFPVGKHSVDWATFLEPLSLSNGPLASRMTSFIWPIKSLLDRSSLSLSSSPGLVPVPPPRNPEGGQTVTETWGWLSKAEQGTLSPLLRSCHCQTSVATGRGPVIVCSHRPNYRSESLLPRRPRWTSLYSLIAPRKKSIDSGSPSSPHSMRFRFVTLKHTFCQLSVSSYKIIIVGFFKKIFIVWEFHAMKYTMCFDKNPSPILSLSTLLLPCLSSPSHPHHFSFLIHKCSFKAMLNPNRAAGMCLGIRPPTGTWAPT